jgi:hypothetical protein
MSQWKVSSYSFIPLPESIPTEIVPDAIVLANAILPRQGEERGLAWYEKQRKERVDKVIK